ncbi:MAG: divalent cation tolerance protein CutA, partial [bacterium]|nr:divalent cation tolerance protein CutA [bacterium]
HGRQGVIEKEPELKVEMVFEEEKMAEVRQALFEAHPYETPAFQFIKFERGG